VTNNTLSLRRTSIFSSEKCEKKGLSYILNNVVLDCGYCGYDTACSGTKLPVFKGSHYLQLEG